jgi:hypothetical protein
MGLGVDRGGAPGGPRGVDREGGTSGLLWELMHSTNPYGRRAVSNTSIPVSVVVRLQRGLKTLGVDPVCPQGSWAILQYL